MTNKELEARIVALEDTIKFQDKKIDWLTDAMGSLNNKTTGKSSPHHDFKVGDRVQFKSWEEINSVDKYCIDDKFLKRLAGTYATIKEIDETQPPSVKLTGLSISEQKERFEGYIYNADMLKPATDEPKCQYKVGDVVEYPSGYYNLPDVGTIIKIYSDVDYVDIQNMYDKKVLEVPIKDIKLFIETKCKFNVGDKVKAVRFTAVCDGIGIVTRSPLNIEEEPYIVTFSNGNVMCVFEQDLEPYTEPRWTFTDDEKVILRNLPEGYKWIARDETSYLTIYKNKPVKHFDDGEWRSGDCNWLTINLYTNLFQSIKWTDDEACEFRKYL